MLTNEWFIHNAKQMVKLPLTAELKSVEYFERGDKRKVRFIWQVGEHEVHKLQITFNLHTKELINLQNDLGCFNEQKMRVDQEKALQIAKNFLCKHSPHYAANCTWIEVLKSSIGFKVLFRQQVNGYDLPHTGCRVIVDFYGNIHQYRQHLLVSHLPIWPDHPIEQEGVLRHYRSYFSLQLKWRIRQSKIDLPLKQALSLVYEPITQIVYVDAMTGQLTKRVWLQFDWIQCDADDLNNGTHMHTGEKTTLEHGMRHMLQEIHDTYQAQSYQLALSKVPLRQASLMQSHLIYACVDHIPIADEPIVVYQQKQSEHQFTLKGVNERLKRILDLFTCEQLTATPFFNVSEREGLNLYHSNIHAKLQWLHIDEGYKLAYALSTLTKNSTTDSIQILQSIDASSGIINWR